MPPYSPGNSAGTPPRPRRPTRVRRSARETPLSSGRCRRVGAGCIGVAICGWRSGPRPATTAVTTAGASSAHARVLCSRLWGESLLRLERAEVGLGRGRRARARKSRHQEEPKARLTTTSSRPIPNNQISAPCQTGRIGLCSAIGVSVLILGF